MPLPPATLELARKADAILFGAVGGPGDESGPRDKRPGLGLLTLRRELGLFANFRPAFLFPELIGASSLKPELVEGLDLMILRELNGDIYYGEPRGITVNAAGKREGVNTMRYTEPEIERIAHVAFRTARERRKKVCSVDKANVLETMQLWRETVAQVGKQYPDVELTHLFVDAASMQLMRAPKQFDVMVMPNMFGDILSDAAAMLTGSIGMLPSASIGEGNKGLYEPVHGSAPDIEGKNIANPLAAILSGGDAAAPFFRPQGRRGQDRARGALGAGGGLPHRGHPAARDEESGDHRDGRGGGRGTGVNVKSKWRITWNMTAGHSSRQAPHWLQVRRRVVQPARAAQAL